MPLLKGQPFLEARFEQYAPTDALEQENVLKETMQHYILATPISRRCGQTSLQLSAYMIK